MNEVLTRLYRLMDPLEYSSDCARMQEILADAGYAATLSDIEWAWKKHSESVSAGWLYPDPEEEIVNVLLRYLQPSA